MTLKKSIITAFTKYIESTTCQNFWDIVYGVRPETKIVCCLDIWNERTSKGLIMSFPALTRYDATTQWERLPSQLLPQSARPGLQPNGLHSPASPWNYSNKIITSSFKSHGSPHPLATAKPASHRPACSLYLLVQLFVLVHDMWCSLPGCDYMCLIYYFQSYLSSVRCPLLGHLMLFRAGKFLPHQWSD